MSRDGGGGKWPGRPRPPLTVCFTCTLGFSGAGRFPPGGLVLEHQALLAGDLLHQQRRELQAHESHGPAAVGEALPPGHEVESALSAVDHRLPRPSRESGLIRSRPPSGGCLIRPCPPNATRAAPTGDLAAGLLYIFYTIDCQGKEPRA